MNRHRIFVSSIASLVFLVIPSALLSYDTSPSNVMIIPECIWAPATGGGTWVTQLQITAVTAGVVVNAAFYYSGGYRIVSNLWTSPGLNSCTKFSNILAILQSLDSGFTYYGRVGSLYLYNSNASYRFQCQARTINGNYGKTLPGLPLTPEGNSAAVARDMMIQDLTQDATHRTFIGVFNSVQTPITASFFIFNRSGYLVGSFTKTVPGAIFGGFMSFNPFVEAGVGSGTYDNCWLFIEPLTGPSSGSGLFCFGSLANNYTNDTSALMAVQYQ